MATGPYLDTIEHSMPENTPKKKGYLSIVMPVYNEQDVIEKVVMTFCKQVLDKFQQSEFIIVNDCSSDNTLHILKSLNRDIPYLRVITLRSNRGHGEALRIAYEASKGDLIFHCDSDNQFVAKDFWLLYNEMREKNLDVALGWRRNRHDPLRRLIITRFVRLACIFLFGVSIRDSNSPFKLHTRKSLDKLLEVVPIDSFTPSIMMAIAARELGMRMTEVPVCHLPRLTGGSFLVKWSLIKACLLCLWQLFIFRFLLNRAKHHA